MDQRSVVLFLSMKSFSVRNIHDELVTVLGPDAIGYSTVTNYLTQSRLTAIILDTLENQSRPLRRCNFGCSSTGTIFFSQGVREAHLNSTKYGSSTLTQTLGSIGHYYRWVPQSLKPAQKGGYVTLANRLFHDLCSIKHQGLQFVVTLDE
jgi:hypothetical protein